MAEKKKMSVAEILAAARKADSKSAGGNGDQPAATPAEPAPSDAAPAPKAAAPAKPAAAPKPGGKMSTADILAAARANKGAAQPAAEAPAKPAAPKPAPKPAAKAPATEKAAPVATAEKDTASILAAARSGAKPGPISKSEAAVMAKSPAHLPGASAEPKAKKPAIIVPPMPAKPTYAQKKPAKAAAATEENRRGFLTVALGSFLGIGFTALGVVTGLWTLGVARFMFPNILTEPPSTFKVGFPADFPPGAVSEKFKAQFGVWVVNGDYNGQPQIYALKTVCTHLGCTPNWLEAEQKFKCPCHGSGFYKDGINFEGPAPRPLERYAIRVADDGQLEIDKSKSFQEEMGHWSDPTSFVPV